MIVISFDLAIQEIKIVIVKYFLLIIIYKKKLTINSILVISFIKNNIM